MHPASQQPTNPFGLSLTITDRSGFVGLADSRNVGFILKNSPFSAEARKQCLVLTAQTGMSDGQWLAAEKTKTNVDFSVILAQPAAATIVKRN